MICKVAFLGETVNITFAVIEASILIALLIVASIYQVVISGLFNNNLDLKNRISLVNAKQKLKLLRFVSIFTSCTVLGSTIAVLYRSFIIDCLSLMGFALVIIIFTSLLIILINNLLKELENNF